MSNILNFYSHQDVITAVKQILGIPHSESLTATLHRALQDDTQEKLSATGQTKVSPANESQLLAQEFECLASTLLQLRKSDEQKCERLIAQLTHALHDNPTALSLVKQLAA